MWLKRRHHPGRQTNEYVSRCVWKGVETMLKSKVFESAILAVPIGMTLVSIVIAIPCNTRNIGPTQSCNEDWAAAVYCSNWDEEACNAVPAQQGAPQDNNGPTISVGCTEPTSNPANHCTTAPINCLPRYWCTNWQGGECKPGAQVTQGNPPRTVWLTEEEAQTASCTPQG